MSSLQFILGGSGCGKTYYLNHLITKEAEIHPETQYLVIVPEQFTMQTQKELVMASERNGIWNIDVLSFLRLAFRCFGETGSLNEPVIDDLGKVLILRKVLANQEKNLVYFGKNIHKKGFVSEVKSFLSELIQYDIQEEDIDDMLQESGNGHLLKSKLQDIKTVYAAFQDYLKDHYITSEEIITLLAQVVTQSAILKNAVICLDGFTGFTPLQYQLLTELMKVCQKMYVTVTVDPKVPISSEGGPHQLFYLSRKTICTLRKLALEQHVEVEKEIWTGVKKEQTRFYQSMELHHLEKSLFRYPIEKYNAEVKDISVHALRQPDQEVSFVMQKIQCLLQQEHCRYKDIAIITGNPDVYNTLLEEAFTEKGYVGFIDVKKSILTNPFVDLLRALTNMLLRDFDYESVMRYARNMLTGLKREDVDLLDNFLLATGIRGYKKWQENWTAKYVYRSRSDESIQYVEDHINKLRLQMVSQLQDIYEQVAKGKHSVHDLCVAYCLYMERMDLYHLLKKKEDSLREENDLSGAKEYAQIYEIVLDIFDHLEKLLGDEEIRLSDFRDLLDTGFDEARVGLIPPGVDQIVVGDLSRTRLSDVKYLFFLGVTDVNIPQSVNGGGIISDVERTLLKEASFSLAPTMREQIFTEQFYYYLVLTKPSKHLYLTYCLMGNDGKAQNPSYLLERIKLLFPKLQTDVEDQKEDVENILSDDYGKKYFIHGLQQGRENDTKWQELYRQYLMNPQAREWTLQMVNAAFYHAEDGALSKEVAKALYDQDGVVVSTSQMEKYAACAFSYFMRYGLCLEERQEHKVEFYDIGNVIHEALELYTEKIIEQKEKWQDLSEVQWKARADECLDLVAAEYKDGLLYDTSRNEYLLTRLRNILYRTIWAITEQMKRGDFRTVNTEVKFSLVDNQREANDSVIKLIGKIDRVDQAEDEAQRYIKIVDYKTGKKEISLNDLYEGLQMQLVVYLYGEMRNAEKKKKDQKVIIPAGILYYNIDDPILDGEVSEEERDAKILEKLRLEGIVNQDQPVLPYLDHCFQGEKLPPKANSPVIPVKIDAKGNISKTSSVMDTKQLQDVMEFADKKLHMIGTQILNGSIGAHPYRKMTSKQETACDYCPYHSICGFDSRISGYTYRTIKSRSNDDAYIMIQQDLEKENKKKEEDGADEQ